MRIYLERLTICTMYLGDSAAYAPYIDSVIDANPGDQPMNDSMLTTHQMIHDSTKMVSRRFRQCWADFAQSEPELADFVVSEAMRFCGVLAFNGAPQSVLRGAHEQIRRLTLTALMSMRRGNFELWRDTALGPRLAALWTGDSEAEASGEPNAAGSSAKAENDCRTQPRRRKIATKLFTVTVFHGEDPEDDDSDDIPAYDDRDLMYSGVRLGSTTVSASNEREAAARAWMELVGEARVEKLKQLNAPAVVIAHQKDLRAIADDVRESALGRANYELFNGVEVWFFQVKPLAAAEERS
jgi:hypothetical protein